MEFPAGFIDGHVRPWTVVEWLGLGEQTWWPQVELIDGGLFVSPEPPLLHKGACLELTMRLAAVEPDLSVAHHPRLVLGEDGGVIPDLAVAFRGCAGGPHLDHRDVPLVVEVESPSTRSVDRSVKAALYAEAGIGCYWRVEMDGGAGPVVCVYRLFQGGYDLQQRVPAGQTLRTVLPAGSGLRFEFDPAVLAGAGP